MYTAIIIHAPIGKGKTETCQIIANRCKEAGIQVGGVISPCNIVDNVKVGYDCIELSSGDRFPLVKLGNPDSDWFHHGTLKYVFSTPGFKRANNILSQCTFGYEIVVIDEFGRMEKNKEGLYPGFQRVASNLKNGFYIIACRGDLVETVRDNLPDGVEVHVAEAGEHKKIWSMIQAS